MYLFALAWNKSVASGVTDPTAFDLARLAPGEFQGNLYYIDTQRAGFTGRVIINQNATRDPVFNLWAIGSDNYPVVVYRYVETMDPGKESIIQQLAPDSALWSKTPLNTPLCGYDG